MVPSGGPAFSGRGVATTSGWHLLPQPVLQFYPSKYYKYILIVLYNNCGSNDTGRFQKNTFSPTNSGRKGFV